MQYEIQIFKRELSSSGELEGSVRTALLSLETESPALVAMNLRALAAELDRQGAPDGGAGNYGPGQPKARAKRSDAGQKRGPVVSAPVEPAVSPFAAPAQP